MHTKSCKVLTTEKYNLLFEILLTSNNPLSSYQIKQEMKEVGHGNSYTYSMLNKLISSPSDGQGRREDYHQRILFNWNNVPQKNKNQNQNLVKILNKFFNLGWTIESSSLTFNKSKDNKVMTIQNNAYSNVIVKIERDSYYLNLAVLRIIDNDTKEEKEKCRVYISSDKTATVILASDSEPVRKSIPHLYYLNDLYRSRLSYIEHTLDDKSKQVFLTKYNRLKVLSDKSRNLISPSPVLKPLTEEEKKGEVKEEKKLAKELREINNDTRKWRYSPNIRTLIKYLLAEIKLENEAKLRVDKKARVHNKRISNILRNLSHNYLKEFPFLLYYDDFKNEYSKLKAYAKLPDYYEVEVLKKIAQELEFQIDNNPDIDFLKYWVTRRYSGELTYYFVSAIKSYMLDSIEDLDYLSVQKIRDYQAECLNLMRRYLESEHNNIQTLYENAINILNNDMCIYL